MFREHRCLSRYIVRQHDIVVGKNRQVCPSGKLKATVEVGPLAEICLISDIANARVIKRLHHHFRLVR